jgi:hypothetical protein
MISAPARSDKPVRARPSGGAERNGRSRLGDAGVLGRLYFDPGRALFLDASAGVGYGSFDEPPAVATASGVGPFFMLGAGWSSAAAAGLTFGVAGDIHRFPRLEGSSGDTTTSYAATTWRAYLFVGLELRVGAR